MCLQCKNLIFSVIGIFTVASLSVSFADNPDRGFGDIQVEPENLNIEVTPGGTAQTDFVVRNTGTGVLTVYTIEADVTWITADPVNFSLNSNEFQTVTITVNASGLTSGTYDQNITVESNDVDEPMVQIPVTVTVAGAPEPDISVVPSALDLTTETGTTVQGTLSVQNVGGADLDVTSITADAGWLGVSIESFTLGAGESQSVVVTADAGNLDPGEYEQSLTIASNDPDESSMIVSVEVTITELQVPDIQVFPMTLTVTMGPGGSAEEIIVVRNTGTADLTVTSISPNAAWISVMPAAFSVAPGDSQSVTVSIDAASNDEGTYEADISINSNDPDEPVVTVSVTETLPADNPSNQPNPLGMTLGRPTPNPFNGSTSIQFSLPESDTVLLTVHDVSGHRIATLANGVQNRGVTTIRWNGSGDSGNSIPAGTYILRLRTGSMTMNRRLVKVD